ncbi:MAG TPA: cob(I)yrinic acid a,c-diamide adenosyltransferase [Thermoanaerobaculia bacterium]|nr:cob(I)yrinic acid a,c-diamide adenosyltransferase [Thermoanaerobaculia bacterium]
MPRITRVYTRTGDDGTTGLATGARIPKASLRVAVFGTVDELNAQVGAAIAAGLDGALAERLSAVQNELFHLGSDLSTPETDKSARPVPVIGRRHVDALERWMDEMSADLPPLENFVLPGGTPGAAQLHVARTVCRRAERLAVRLGGAEAIGENVIPYLNRLSDALFVAARFENRRRNRPDVLWNSRV